MTTLPSAFAGEVIYLDTMLPYLLLRGADPTVRPFFERIERGEFLACASALTFDELAYRLLLTFIKDHHDDSPLERLRDEEEKVMAEFAPTVVALLRRLRTLTQSNSPKLFGRISFTRAGSDLNIQVRCSHRAGSRVCARPIWASFAGAKNARTKSPRCAAWA